MSKKDTSFIKRAALYVQENGFVGTTNLVYKNITKRLCKVFRLMLPATDYATYNKVKLPPDIAPKRRIGDQYLPARCTPNKEIYKGYLKFLRKLIDPGDDVTIIGGGRGVSTVVAAKQVGTEGSVTVFEGSTEMAKLIEKVTRLNGVWDRITILPVVVESPIEVYSDGDNFEIISAADLEPCDLLLLDCEGAEYEIMKTMKIEPRYIVGEFHPDRVPHSADKFLEYVPEYSIIHSAKYYGETVSEDKFKDLLERRKIGESDVDGTYVKNPIAVLENKL